MQFKKFRSEEEVRDTLTLKMLKGKVRKNTLSLSLGISYPTILSKLENPFSFKVSELLLVCEIVNMDINDLLIKY